MPKVFTFPTLFDEVRAFSVSDLKKWGYLRSNQFKSGIIIWKLRGELAGSVSITGNTRDSKPYIELDYNYVGSIINYRIRLVSVPSNIGKGEVWYFLCPHTGKRCRKLYAVGEKFLHRKAYRGCMYESQTYSSNSRHIFKLCDKLFGSDKLYEQLYSKHFKRTYAGKPTRRYLKLMKKIMESEQMSYSEIEMLFLA